jgi:hypothetical protein
LGEQAKARVKSQESECNTQQHIPTGNQELSIANQGEGLQLESGKSREAANDSGEQEKPSFNRKIVLFGRQTSQDSNCQASEYVDKECAYWESPGGGISQDPASQQVAGN